MARTYRRIAAYAAAWVCTVCVCGCTSALHPAASARPGGPPSNAPASAEPAYEWRALLLVPFGTLLKDMPFALDEVLVFHDAAGAAPSGAPNDLESGDCFSTDGASAPQFLARRPDSYLLCFEHDRLRRIETSVHLAEAGPLPGALCAQWLSRAQDSARLPDGCAGREGAVEWRVRSTQGPGSSVDLSITLIDARAVPRE
jgi:hypothetical protein